MLGLFKAKLPVDQDEFDWLLACVAWLLEEFGGIEGLRLRNLVLPEERFFPRSQLTGHARALELFDQVKALAGMADWQCDLIPGAAEREARVTTGHALRHAGAPPLGTFGYDNGRYYITYRSSEVERPHSLVATFAHELAHYLLHTARTAPPGGRELSEHATDLAAVFLGFGVFMANSAKSFSQFQNFGEIGWEMRGAGYLSELALTTGLALFIRLTDADPKAAEREMKDYLRAPLRKALAAIDRAHPDLVSTVEDVDLGDWR